MFPKLALVPLAFVPLMPKLLLLLLAHAVPVAPLLLLPPKPACEKPSGFAVGPLHDANKLNKCRFNSLDNNVVRLSTVPVPMTASIENARQHDCYGHLNDETERAGERE